MQKTASWIGFTFLGLLLALGVLGVCECTRVSAGQVAVPPHTTDRPAGEFKVVAYYFHGSVRCATCRKIEAYAHETVQSSFGDALKAGTLEWKAVNVEEPANQHFIKEYQLYTRSVVLSLHQGEKQLRWKNLDQVWNLVGEKPKFTRYVQEELKSFLEAR